MFTKPGGNLYVVHLDGRGYRQITVDTTFPSARVMEPPGPARPRILCGEPNPAARVQAPLAMAMPAIEEVARTSERFAVSAITGDMMFSLRICSPSMSQDLVYSRCGCIRPTSLAQALSIGS